MDNVSLLRAMANNYINGHSIDHLDIKAFENSALELAQLRQRVIDLEGSRARSVNLREQLAVCQQRVAESSEDSLRLIETIKYLVGIAEKGEGRELREHETIEKFVLGYVVKLEQRVAELEAHNVSLTLEQTMRKAGEKSNIRLATELAASKLENKRLRSALEVATSICWSNFSEAQEVILTEALREPTDTEALEDYVKERLGDPVAWRGMTGHGAVISVNKPAIQPDNWTPLYALKEPK